MTIRQVGSGVVIAGMMTLGLGAVAYADKPPVPPATARAHRHCGEAAKRLARLETILARDEARITKLQAAKAKAEQAGNAKLVSRVEHRLDRARAQRDKVTDRIARLKARCGLA